MAESCSGALRGIRNRTLNRAAEIYDPADGTFSPIGDWLATGAPVAVLADGRVLFDSNQLYDPAIGVFSDG